MNRAKSSVRAYILLLCNDYPIYAWSTNKAGRMLREYMSKEDHKFPRKFLYAFDVIGIGAPKMRVLLEGISHDGTVPDYVRGYAMKILGALPDAAHEAVPEAGPAGNGIEQNVKKNGDNGVARPTESRDCWSSG